MSNSRMCAENIRKCFINLLQQKIKNCLCFNSLSTLLTAKVSINITEYKNSEKYPKLILFKDKKPGIYIKKSKILTYEQVYQLLYDVNDDKYVTIKVFI